MKFIKLSHKWVSLLVMVQMFIWLGSGLYFNLMDHHKAGGHTYRAHHPVMTSDRSFIPLAQLPHSDPIKGVGVIYLLNEPYYRISSVEPLYPHWEGQYQLFHAVTGEPVSIDQDFAARLAMASYSGPGAVSSASKLSPPISDLPKERNPVWQVNFSDDVNTSVYLRQQSGQIVAHVDDHRRLRDLLFMLHFMDYANEGSFNNIQIIILAMLTLWLALTGFIWTVNLFREGQLSLRLSKGAHQVTVDIVDGQQQQNLILSTDATLYDSLWQQDVLLPSSCGGGGTCGQCRIKAHNGVQITSADKEQLTPEQLRQGWRLACQHKAKHFTRIMVPQLQQPLPRHTLKLRSERFLSPVIKELTFEPVGDTVPPYQAGAHLRFEIPQPNGGQGKTYRHYSLATYSEDPKLVFNVRHHPSPNETVPPGIGSDYLCQLKPGDKVHTLGPIEGFAIDPNHSGTKVLLGAGSGMAPLKAMIQSLLADADCPPVYFYYGARSEEDLLYWEEFIALQTKHAHFHYYPVLSQPSSDWTGEVGYVQEAMFTSRHKIERFNEAQFYLCGPQSMMQQTIKRLTAHGISSQAIFFDNFGEPLK
ncbi:2Fe-2S iron-sulfur cluster-binding protein [Alteromonas ponticola]|uniref:2Fe-2S iron-sulfur cluster-binding protein n=1 Tax=Alteromonas aquimaris TaxID=2998417 RepID=A0ABT3PAW2_9ALTE|nr:2Fe-2S iron-sulfur cluster-binding protein [Alteromonas aquimaris]MCW8109917.1 2Fe-2S iron-sulfur cluster-binding protein [Alteromonas aquimaris]